MYVCIKFLFFEKTRTSTYKTTKLRLCHLIIFCITAPTLISPCWHLGQTYAMMLTRKCMKACLIWQLSYGWYSAHNIGCNYIWTVFLIFLYFQPVMFHFCSYKMLLLAAGCLQSTIGAFGKRKKKQDKIRCSIRSSEPPPPGILPDVMRIHVIGGNECLSRPLAREMVSGSTRLLPASQKNIWGCFSNPVGLYFYFGVDLITIL
jgi:hypothetical protein